MNILNNVYVYNLVNQISGGQCVDSGWIPFCYCCRMMQTTGFCLMLKLALQICGERIVSFFKDVPLFVFYPCYSFSSFLFDDYYLTVGVISSFTMTTIAGVGWNGADILHSDFGVPDVSITRPQTPPSGIAEIPPHAVNFSQRWIVWLAICRNFMYLPHRRLPSLSIIAWRCQVVAW